VLSNLSESLGHFYNLPQRCGSNLFSTGERNSNAINHNLQVNITHASATTMTAIKIKICHCECLKLHFLDFYSKLSNKIAATDNLPYSACGYCY